MPVTRSGRRFSRPPIQHRRLARAARRRRRLVLLEELQTQRWLEANKHYLGTDSLTADWEAVKERVSPRLMAVAVRYLATAEAAETVNDTFRLRLNMPEAGLSPAAVDEIVRGAVSVELMSIILEDSAVPAARQRQMLRHAVARAFPLPGTEAAAPRRSNPALQQFAQQVRNDPTLQGPPSPPSSPRRPASRPAGDAIDGPFGDLSPRENPFRGGNNRAQQAARKLRSARSGRPTRSNEW